MNFSKSFLIIICFLSFLSNSMAQTDRESSLSERCKTARTASEQKKINEILSVARARTTALVARDASKLKQLLSSNFVYTNASGKVFDRDSYIQNYASDKSVSWSSQTLSDVCVIFSSDVAVLTGKTHDIARFGDYQLNARFLITQIYQRADGGWIYLAGHTSEEK